MGKGIGNRRHESCWAYRSTFEKALIFSSLLPFIIVVILITFLLFQLNFVGKTPHSCTNPVCQIEASQLAQRIDPSTNPCNDFYQFSCGSLWKNNITSDPFSTIIQDSKNQVLKIYNEPIKVTDYRVVKAAKMLYRTCLNATEIRKNDLEFINKTLDILGGWPVVRGSHWNDSQFWWLEVTQVLRRSGLFYGSVIDVSVIPDNKTDSKFILKVALPEPSSMQINDINDFVEVAVALGAHENTTQLDYEEIYNFSLDLRRELFRRYTDDPPMKYTIDLFQRKYEFINWIEFINNILSPVVKFRSDETVLFDSADGFKEWFNFLSKTPKRTLANYMIWKALEKLLPYIQNRPEIYENERPTFCIKQVRDRFSPSPLDILYVQTHFPEVKMTLAKDMVNNMKTEVVDLLGKCDWLNTTEKTNAKERLANITLVVGAPRSCLNRDIFYQLDDDMNEVDENDDSFISNLAKANKKYQSQVYRQVETGEMLKWSLETGSVIGDYYWDDNTINIPATVLQGGIFNEARPKFVNYGSIGMLLSHHFYRILIGEKTRDYDSDINTNVYKKFEDKLGGCLDLQPNNTYLVDIVLQQSLGFQISYGAYKKSVHSKEDVGFGGYTPNQLYWLSAASYFCQPDQDFANVVGNSTETSFISNLFLSSVASNKNFGDDFHCASETRMYPKEKCNIF